MAFDRQNWARSTDSMNTGQETLKNGAIVNAPAIFTYRSLTDNQATISGSDYFAPAVHDLALNDIIFTVGSDAVAVYVVATIDRIARTITVAGASIVGSVDTANIVNEAVTTPKIDDNAVTTAKINAGAVTLAKLDAGVAPSHVVKFADVHTTTGGSASEAIAIVGADAADIPRVTVMDQGSNAVTVVGVAVTTDTLTVEFSADPGNDAVISYSLLRAAV